MICRHDRTAEVCRAAVEEDGWQLENVPEEVKTPELCRKALETEAGFGNDRFRLVQHIPSPEVCMEVLKECSKVCPEDEMENRGYSDQSDQFQKDQYPGTRDV